ncbi:phage shock protein E [Seminavis robusta]|uniref:Phage shock protein E n=1 Tax=Seminavis robusta TaxID=568900 RepID=A0A9N8EWZ2_9STRA|nr:phage shock protein E [Seminavis robusta]|eukprot:Sro2282_g321840.1 phage shock protein E (679) ;mRNA; r:9419-11553
MKKMATMSNSSRQSCTSTRMPASLWIVSALLLLSEQTSTCCAFLSRVPFFHQHSTTTTFSSPRPSSLFLTPAHIDSADHVLNTFAQPNAIILDVRSQPEIDCQGLIHTHRPWLQTSCTPMECPSLSGVARTMFPDKNIPIIVHCSSGMRAAKAKEVLETMGYTQVVNAGAFEDLGYLQLAADKAMSAAGAEETTAVTAPSIASRNKEQPEHTTTDHTTSTVVKPARSTGQQKPNLPIVDAVCVETSTTAAAQDNYGRGNTAGSSNDNEEPSEATIVDESSSPFEWSHHRKSNADSEAAEVLYSSMNEQQQHDSLPDAVYSNSKFNPNGFARRGERVNQMESIMDWSEIAAKSKADASSTSSVPWDNCFNEFDAASRNYGVQQPARVEEPVDTGFFSDSLQQPYSNGADTTNNWNSPVQGHQQPSAAGKHNMDQPINWQMDQPVDPTVIFVDSNQPTDSYSNGATNRNDHYQEWPQQPSTVNGFGRHIVEPVDPTANFKHSSFQSTDTYSNGDTRHDTTSWDSHVQGHQQPSAAGRHMDQPMDWQMDQPVDPTVIFVDSNQPTDSYANGAHTTNRNDHFWGHQQPSAADRNMDQPIDSTVNFMDSLQPNTYDVVTPSPNGGTNAPDDPNDFFFESLEPSIFDESYHGERDLASDRPNSPDDPDRFFYTPQSATASGSGF